MLAQYLYSVSCGVACAPNGKLPLLLPRACLAWLKCRQSGQQSGNRQLPPISTVLLADLIGQ